MQCLASIRGLLRVPTLSHVVDLRLHRADSFPMMPWALRLRNAWNSGDGIATAMPVAVQSSASEIPAARVLGSSWASLRIVGAVFGVRHVEPNISSVCAAALTTSFAVSAGPSPTWDNRFDYRIRFGGSTTSSARMGMSLGRMRRGGTSSRTTFRR